MSTGSFARKESNSAADCCLNMASGILQLVVGPDHDKAVLARLNDGFFAIVTVGTPAAQMARAVNEAMNASRRGIQHLAVPPRQLPWPSPPPSGG